MMPLLTLLFTFLTPAQPSEAQLLCQLSGSVMKTFEGKKWLGHGVHYSIGSYGNPKKITYQGQDYFIEATFSTYNGHDLMGSRVSIQSENYKASGDTMVTLEQFSYPYTKLSLECEFESNTEN